MTDRSSIHRLVITRCGTCQLRRTCFSPMTAGAHLIWCDHCHKRTWHTVKPAIDANVR